MAPSIYSLMAHSAVLAKDLNDTHRLPPTYVGVRRVRPSTKQVQSAWVGANERNDIGSVIFKVKNEDGTERRMTTKEKKGLKIKLRKDRYDSSKKKRAVEKAGSTQRDDDALIKIAGVSFTNNNDSKYHQLQLDSSALEEELADLRGDRHGVPPVLLSPPMTIQARSLLMNATIQRPTYRLDDELSKAWAGELKQGMLAAEQVRNAEDIRPMAYQVVPEVWTRLRPESLKDGVAGDDVVVAGTNVFPDESTWTMVAMRKSSHSSDSANTILVDLFYHHSQIHISCGVKFGCDYLLYDGRRHERHAFAGLRVMVDEANPYDLAGYVRGLNTAGKLALVAKVEADGSVALVDLALEKILTAPTHLKRKRKQARKDVGQKLTKTIPK